MRICRNCKRLNQTTGVYCRGVYCKMAAPEPAVLRAKLARLASRLERANHAYPVDALDHN